MSRGKYLSLEEARKKDKQGNDKLDQFAKEHESQGDKKQFDQLFQAMAKSVPLRSRARFVLLPTWTMVSPPSRPVAMPTVVPSS